MHTLDVRRHFQSKVLAGKAMIVNNFLVKVRGQFRRSRPLRVTKV